MTLLKRWEPFRDLTRIDGEFDRMWRHMCQPTYVWPRFAGRNARPPIDIYHEGNNLVVRAVLPGVKPEDLEVTVADDTLKIKGETKFEKEIGEDKYLHREHDLGSFRRAVRLPNGLDAKKADASYANGVLTVTVPRTEDSKSQPLKIKVESPEAKKS